MRVRLLQHTLQPFVRNKISTPYLSPAFFKSLCDFTVDPDNPLTNLELKQIRLAETVYCKSSQLTRALDEFSELLVNKVIVSGDSDYDFTDPNLPIGRVRKLFLQNSFISDGKKVITLPIGVENISLGINGLPWNLRPARRPQIEKILVGPFSMTHPSRNDLMTSARKVSGITILDQALTPREYAQISSGFKAIACPRGNGEDTHRIWESLYRATYPILIRNTWSESLKDLGLPLILIASWTAQEIIEVRKNLTLKTFSPKSHPSLWSDFWLRKIRDH